MPDNLVIAPGFVSTLENLMSHPRQSILLHGAKGVGLLTIARTLSSRRHLLIQPLNKNSEYDEISGTITVERIRELYQDTRSNAYDFVIIDDADRMTAAAQNAFLKLLEEPNSSLHFVLTSHHPESLLPTVSSRTLRYHVPPLDEAASRTLLTKLKLPEDMWARVLFLANGRPAELVRLASEPNNLELKAAVMADARVLLSGSTRYDRLIVALRYASSRAQAIELVDAALVILKATLYAHPTHQNATLANRLLETHSALAHNSSPKLQLTYFVLQ